MRLSKFNFMANGVTEAGKTAVFNTLTEGLAVIDDAMLRVLEMGGHSGISAEELKSLEDAGIVVRDDTDEDALFDLYYNQIRFKNSILRVTLLTTLNCNFACSYCYEGGLTSGKKMMSMETADDAVSWIKARAEENRVSQIEVEYHGGEPLLNIPVIERIGRNLKAYSVEKRIRYSAHMISNGYLLNGETARRVAEAGVRSVRVTIDGPEDIHDSMRFLKGGGGTFNTIIKNIREAKEFIKVAVGGNFTKDTASRAPELLDALIKEGLGSESIYRVQFFPVLPSDMNAGAAGFDSGCISMDGMHEDYLRLQEEVVKRGFEKYPEPRISPCQVVLASDFTINYNGAIYKCPGLVDHPGYEIGDVREELRYNAEMLRSLSKNTFDNLRCRTCNILPLCLGGCRFIALAKTGRFHEIDCDKGMLEAVTLDAVRRMAAVS